MSTTRGKITANQRRYRQNKVRVDQENAPHPVLWRVLLLLGIALGIGLYYVGQTKRRDDLQRNYTALEREISGNTKEIDNIRMQLESFKNGRYIMAKVEEKKLGLRPPLPGQVRRVTLVSSGRAHYADDSFSGAEQMGMESSAAVRPPTTVKAE